MMRLAVAGLLLFVTVPAIAQTQPQLTGATDIHDPTWTIVEGVHLAFATGVEGDATGGAIRVKTSPDGIAWENAGTIGRGVPEWAEAAIGSKPPNIWAPSIFERDGTHYLYFSVSRFGRNTSAIGLMTNDALDPARPNEGWVDQGVVLSTTTSDSFNAIDPARIDTPDGRAWLVFGSHWDGIRMIELEPATGKVLEPDGKLHWLASRGGGAIEAPSILARDGRFYLFVSFDRCCQGMASTYRIMVGRSDAITGPYVDKEGIPMLVGGGSLVQDRAGRVIGPGGQEAFATPDGDVLVYHYYDQRSSGLPRLQISPIRWSEDGWPVLDPVAQ